MGDTEDIKPVIEGIPRGLIPRERGSSRLPSLRRDPHSSMSSMIPPNMTSNSTTPNLTTKGGALKRTFKPTIPQRRNQNEDNADVKQSTDNRGTSRRGRPPKNSSHNSRSKGNDSKNWIQTEGAVFRGEDNPQLRSSRMREESSTRSRLSNGNDFKIKSEDNSDEKGIKTKIENKAKIIRKLYGDNFIDDNDSHTSDKHILYPKGWQTVSTRHHPYSAPTTEPLNAYNLLKTESQDKLVLMQISEEFLKRGDGYVGKMRVYKSGRIELHDSESDIKFDMIFDRNSNSTQSIKQENENRLTKQTTENSYEDISEDVVTFSGNSLCVLSQLAHKQVMLAVPHLPSDHVL